MKIIISTHAKIQNNSLHVFFIGLNNKDKPILDNFNFEKEIKNKITYALKNNFFSAKKNQHLFFFDTKIKKFPNLLFIGLDKISELNGESLRNKGSNVYNFIQKNNFNTINIYINDIINVTNNKNIINIDLNAKNKTNHKALEAKSLLTSFIQGLILTSYDFNDLKNKKEIKEKNSTKNISLIFYKKDDYNYISKITKEAQIISESIIFARKLGDNPGNLMTPKILVETTKKEIKGIKNLSLQVWNKEKIIKEKMNALLAVSKGSNEEPRFIILKYQGTSIRKKPICFVGKGLTFDSGGISLKPSSDMNEMKYDMCGGANVIATLIAIAKLKLKLNVIGLIPACENLPGPNATKPGDIIKAKNGTTIEVNNTDAEGRLILADVLCYACEQKPEIIIDIATLTGAMVVCLGNIHTGFYTKNNKLLELINLASQKSEELIWNLPLHQFHTEDIKGFYADLSNISKSKGAGSATAAAFLEEFVDKNIPWAHFDIAGTAYNTNNRLSYCPKKGATGVMIRTFIEIAKIKSNN